MRLIQLTATIAQGRYYENISIDINNIVLTSTDSNDTDVAAKTIIDGNGTDSTVTFAGVECYETVLSGFTITNGYPNYGGGIYCFNGSNPIITNCTITNNTVNNEGNSPAFNSSQQAYPSNIQVINCILWNGGGEIWNNDDSTIAISYSDVTGGWVGDGNIDENPTLEVDGYHLMPDSPCKGMADPLGDYNGQVDIDCKPRVVGSGMDIGCDEFSYLCVCPKRNELHFGHNINV